MRGLSLALSGMGIAACDGPYTVVPWALKAHDLLVVLLGMHLWALGARHRPGEKQNWFSLVLLCPEPAYFSPRQQRLVVRVKNPSYQPAEAAKNQARVETEHYYNTTNTSEDEGTGWTFAAEGMSLPPDFFRVCNIG